MTRKMHPCKNAVVQLLESGLADDEAQAAERKSSEFALVLKVVKVEANSEPTVTQASSPESSDLAARRFLSIDKFKIEDQGLGESYPLHDPF